MAYTWGYIKDVSLSKLDLDENEATVQNLLSRFPFYANEVITQVCSSIKPKYTFENFVIDKTNVGVKQTMPDDFVSFGDDVCYMLEEVRERNGETRLIKVPIHDDDYEYLGYNQVVFKHPGNYFISYNARWYTFDKSLSDDELIDVPDDILDSIPSYIASQCYKIDDEYKASVFRNEYEIMLSRIDNSNFRNTKTIKIEGDW
nr:MAG TPA: hypothetical protein [Caudoviricetes sp.]